MEVRIKATIEPHITIRLSESELRAFEAIAGYGTKEFLKVFYEHLGSHYLKPHEEGLKSLFEGLRTQTKQELYKIDEAKKMFNQS